MKNFTCAGEPNNEGTAPSTEMIKGRKEPTKNEEPKERNQFSEDCETSADERDEPNRVGEGTPPVCTPQGEEATAEGTNIPSGGELPNGEHGAEVKGKLVDIPSERSLSTMTSPLLLQDTLQEERQTSVENCHLAQALHKEEQLYHEMMTDQVRTDAELAMQLELQLNKNLREQLRLIEQEDFKLATALQKSFASEERTPCDVESSRGYNKVWLFKERLKRKLRGIFRGGKANRVSSQRVNSLGTENPL
ncbi:conserved Plasmodium protein, unknown function [Plasmodium vivax]|uniref:Uncharacterized protein n=1 Tax=Plasmodium vivax TaxID=5855 RepID=A0A564ZUM7_PLAVI|nr:conserved Plasmodium protein, unknown function [Plasmodium vivax]